MKPIHHFVLNLILALIWVILNQQVGIFDFIVGYALGFAILCIFHPLLKTTAYVHRVKALVQFAARFIWLFLKANFDVAYLILFVSKKGINPSFMRYDVSQLSHFEALLISHFLALTPGTITVNLEKESLLIHVLDLKDPIAVTQEIDNYLKDPILRFTRCL